MSSTYSANQYASAFNPHRLQNWGETKHFKQISFQEENVEVTPPCTTEAQPSAQNRPPTQSSASAAHAAPLHPTCAAGMDKSSSNNTAEAQGLAGDGSEGKPQLESSSNILQADTQR
ncbi:Protein Flattop [Oryzias melastigma]|uniref:Protein Flattop n=1 Tax=Oryzias melastigma TaxID=30732 RepID=A0A834EZH7_ORYME|nr:Protein Flattop [Oryzias melastigma]